MGSESPAFLVKNPDTRTIEFNAPWADFHAGDRNSAD
jgi:hypothetical protein